MQLFPENTPLSAEQISALTAPIGTLTREQNLWLSGFLAGRISPTPQNTPSAKNATPITVLYGTESGNAETLGDDACKKLKKLGFKPKLVDMADIAPADLTQIKNLIVIISTWGDGEPPERATEFHDALLKETLKLDNTHFAVCGLGDSSYEQFCKMGDVFDKRLAELGGKRLAPRIDCDVDFEDTFEAWFKQVLAELGKNAPTPASAQTLTTSSNANTWSKTNPFPAKLIERINLSGTGSAKETIHLEFSLEGSGIDYKPGDTLGIKPHNCPQMVDELLSATGFSAEEVVKGKSLRTIIIRELDATALSKKVLEAYTPFATNSEKLIALLGKAKELKAYLQGRQIIDLINDFPPQNLTPEQLVSLLRAQPPRLYSIASSIKAHPEEVHLTVGVVRYDSHGRPRKGVTSTFLADRLDLGDEVDIFIQKNNHFKLPENPDTPIIMIGPGTGIAPFRAFVEERAESGAKGKNWLFFGDQHYHFDFLYQLEWQDFIKEGVLTKLDVAFSRDAPEKYYVQHCMMKNAAELWQWLQDGAHLYVCGDASRMAKDVNNALINIVSEHGKMSQGDAKKYVSKLSKDKRYQKDVY